MEPHALSATEGPQRSVIYIYANAPSTTRSGGSRSWRNANPGNLRPSPFTQRHGAIGAAGGFAVFPTDHAGFAALIALLKTRTYQALSLQNAIARFAPQIENDTPTYLRALTHALQVAENTPLANLTPAQTLRLAQAIQTHEGWRVGIIT